jgi:D-3-phosphoglycerate dehydrogenase
LVRVLIIDTFSEAHLGALSLLGLTVDYQPQLAADALGEALADATILIARSKEVRAAAIERGRALSLIVRAGAGVNTIDVKTASAHGIYVANCPGKNAVAVAELTLGLLLALDRRIPDQVRDLRAGAWNKKEYGKADGLYGRTLGVVGTGAIGREVIRRARAFGMPVVAWSRSLDDARAIELGVERMRTVSELCARADAVTLHVALAAETRGLIGEAALSRMRPRTMLVNAARAEVVDEAALRQAIADKQIRYASDVFAGEPKTATGAFADALGTSDAVYGTHHVGASTAQAQSAIADETVRIVRAFVERGEVPNCVNLATRSPAAFQLVVRHYDKVGVLAEVLGAIRRHDINVEEMANTIFDGARAASAKIRLGARPPAELLEEIRKSSPAILHVDVVEIPA